MKVYLDDLRTPPSGWILVKTAKAAINLLKTNKVTDISLDHDFGDEKKFGTGYDVIVWIEKQIYTNKKFKIPNIKIHTANISARHKMELGLKSILKYKNNIKENNLLLKNFINENPDFVHMSHVNFSSSDGMAFGIYNNKLYIGEPQGVHYHIFNNYKDERKSIGLIDRDEYKYPGRIWYLKKVISFWKYPPKNKIIQIFNDIKKEANKKFNINIGSASKYKIDLANDTVIPLTKFLKLAGKQKRSKKQLQLKHMISPVAKYNKDVPSGVGSNKFPAGMSYSQYSQLIRTSENKMKIIKLSNFINEIESFLKPSNDRKVSNVGLEFGRKHKPGSFTYGLNKDGWFRRLDNPGKGNGILIRKIKISGGAKDYGYSFKSFPILLTYWPEDYKDGFDMSKWAPEDDNKSNYKREKGMLYVANEFSADDVIKFINKQIQNKTYIP